MAEQTDWQARGRRAWRQAADLSLGVVLGCFLLIAWVFVSESWHRMAQAPGTPLTNAERACHDLITAAETSPTCRAVAPLPLRPCGGGE